MRPMAAVNDSQLDWEKVEAEVAAVSETTARSGKSIPTWRATLKR